MPGFLGLPGARDELKRVVKSFLYMLLEKCKDISESVVRCSSASSRYKEPACCSLLSYGQGFLLVFSFPLLPGCCIIITLRISVAFKINIYFSHSWIFVLAGIAQTVGLSSGLLLASSF